MFGAQGNNSWNKVWTLKINTVKGVKNVLQMLLSAKRVVRSCWPRFELSSAD